MRIKIKDLELALEHIRLNSISESVEVEYSVDNIGLLFEFTDKNKNISKVKMFDANVSATPEVMSTKKLYRED
ncbi:hypothetical protein EBU95_03940 [bacterium]|nr:hypothetical protein [bacterium]